MVAFDSKFKNHCIKTLPQNPSTNSVPTPLTGQCGNVNNSSTNVLLSPLMHKNSQTRLLIKTDTSRTRKIGLNVNTNVHLKPKKRCDYMYYINELCLIMLVIYGVVSYFEMERLKADVEVTKLKLTIMVNSFQLSLDMMEKSSEYWDNSMQLNLEMMKNLINDFEGNNNKDAVNMRQKNDTVKHLKKRDTTGEVESELACSNCSSNSYSRTARSVTRGPLAIHLRGALPEITVRDGGVIAPWYIDKSSSGSFLLVDGIVGERRGILEIAEEGLYYIYAQIYYLTSSSLNSYAINVQLGEGRGREDSIIAMCSAEAAAAKLAELSCFTATVRYLRRGDSLYVTQRERNRRIIFRDNQSYLGIVLLNSHGKQ